MTALHIACAADARYLAHSAAMLHSLVSSQNGVPVKIHFLHGPDLETARLRPLQTMLAGTSGSLVPHEIHPSAIDGLPAWGRIPTTMWYRILLPDLLPEVDRVLYLDVDVLVLASLSDLWRLDLRAFYLAAVTNVPDRHLISHASEIGLSGRIATSIPESCS